MEARELSVKDLRIGNLVRIVGTDVDYHDCEVDCILTKEVSLTIIGDGEEWLSMSKNVLIKNIEPIPLTEDWLLRFGYTATTSNSAGKRYSQVVKGVFAADLTMTYWETTPDAGKIFRLDRQIKYVHQLQNLYFALTGSELSVKQTTEVNQ